MTKTSITIKEWRKKIREVLYEASIAESNFMQGVTIKFDRNKYIDKIVSLLSTAQEKAKEEGFKQGFNDCKRMVERGEHVHCCIVPGSVEEAREIDKRKIIELAIEGESVPSELKGLTLYSKIMSYYDSLTPPTKDEFDDLKPFTHGEEGNGSTHYACAEMANGEGETQCCACTGHSCQMMIATEKKGKDEK